MLKDKDGSRKLELDKKEHSVIGMYELNNPTSVEGIRKLTLSESFKKCTGLNSIDEYIAKYETTAERYPDGLLFYALVYGKVEALMMYTPIKKELYRALEDHVVINMKSINYEMFTEDHFNGNYGLILGPLTSQRDIPDSVKESLINFCIKRENKRRHYIAIIESENDSIFYSNKFCFIGDIKNKYLVIR